MLRGGGGEQPDPHAIEQYLDGIHALIPAMQASITDVTVFLLTAKHASSRVVVLPVSGGAELGYRQ